MKSDWETRRSLIFWVKASAVCSNVCDRLRRQSYSPDLVPNPRVFATANAPAATVFHDERLGPFCPRQLLHIPAR